MLSPAHLHQKKKKREGLLATKRHNRFGLKLLYAGIVNGVTQKYLPTSMKKQVTGTTWIQRQPLVDGVSCLLS